MEDANVLIKSLTPIEEIFALKVCDPLEWFKHARSLLAAARSTIERAKILIDPWERSDLENVACMLYGFSLENLLKAKWVLNKYGPAHETTWRPEAKFPVELKTHDLTRLAGLVDPSLVNDYKLSLEVMSDTATWSGRYPCSVTGKEGGSIRYAPAIEDAEAIFKRCSREFTALS
jgi:hypothetical protein